VGSSAGWPCLHCEHPPSAVLQNPHLGGMSLLQPDTVPCPGCLSPGWPRAVGRQEGDCGERSLGSGEGGGKERAAHGTAVPASCRATPAAGGQTVPIPGGSGLPRSGDRGPRPPQSLRRTARCPAPGGV